MRAKAQRQCISANGKALRPPHMVRVPHHDTHCHLNASPAMTKLILYINEDKIFHINIFTVLHGFAVCPGCEIYGVGQQ